MRTISKLQFLVLFLAVIVFSGKEFLHPVFHAHAVEQPCFEQSHSAQSMESKLEHADNSVDGSLLEVHCPVCDSLADKSIIISSIESSFFNCELPTIQELYESVPFSLHRNPVSRGPPHI